MPRAHEQACLFRLQKPLKPAATKLQMVASSSAAHAERTSEAHSTLHLTGTSTSQCNIDDFPSTLEMYVALLGVVPKKDFQIVSPKSHCTTARTSFLQRWRLLPWTVRHMACMWPSWQPLLHLLQLLPFALSCTSDLYHLQKIRHPCLINISNCKSNRNKPYTLNHGIEMCSYESILPAKLALCTLACMSSVCSIAC